MVRAGWSVVVQVLVLSGGLQAAEAGSGLDPKIAGNLKVRWRSVNYHKSVAVENPEISRTQGQSSETLTLTCQVELRDPNLVLGTGRQGGITQLVDGSGRSVAVGVPAFSPRDTYEALRYERRFSGPTPPPRWQTFLEKIIQRPVRRPGPPGPPQFATQVRPPEFTMQLNMGLLDQAAGEIQSVKGYFYALLAGSTEYVDVPFEPNNAWVRLTPNLEIQVEEADRGNMFFRYKINVRPQRERSMHLMVGQPVPARFVAAQLFIGEDGKPLDSPGGAPWLPAYVGGMGTHSGSNSRVKAIRFVIAVDAKACRIPFEVRNIPLPQP